MDTNTFFEGISVVICCYNSASRIEKTLEYLAGQEFTEINWEVILVDNGSTDNTVERAKNYWKTQPAKEVNLSIVAEPKIGLSNARATGIATSRYDIIIFCDDDNWLSKNYVTTAWRLMATHVEVGVLGGWCDGVYEIPLKKSLSLMPHSVPLDRGDKKNGYVNHVCGAGMIIRKKLYLNIMRQVGDSLSVDRKGNQLSSGGDTEICWRMQYAGAKVMFNDSLYFNHFMPATRLTNRYFFRLFLSAISGNIILSEYYYCFIRTSHSYIVFVMHFLWGVLKSLLYFVPRMLVGQNKFYAVVNVLFWCKLILLILTRWFFFRKTFYKISQQRAILSRSNFDQ